MNEIEGNFLDVTHALIEEIEKILPEGSTIEIKEEITVRWYDFEIITPDKLRVPVRIVQTTQNHIP